MAVKFLPDGNFFPQLSHKICFLKWERVIFCKIILCSSSFRLKRNPFARVKGFRWMCKRVQTAPEGQEGLKAPQVHRPVVSPLKEDAAPGGLPQKSSPERAAEYSKICFFLLTLFQSLFLFCTYTRGYGDFQPPILRAVFLRHLQCLCPLGAV